MIRINKMIMDARKEQNADKLSAYQMIKAKIMEFKTQKNCPDYTEDVEVNILKKMVKELEEDVEMFKNNDRQEMLEQAEAQLSFIKPLVPEAPSEEAIEEYVNENYPSIKRNEMGVVIKDLKSKFPGVDGRVASTIVKSHING